MSEPLRARGIGRCVGGDRWLWRGFDLALLPGEHVGLAGPSGSGKSSLLRVLAALDPLDEGDLQLGDRGLDDVGASTWRTRVVYLHQKPAMTPGTVADALRRPFALHAWAGRTYDEASVRHRIERLGRDPDRLLATATTALSGGEAQIVALLRALQLEPPILLLDEPTASLDAAATEAVEQLIRDWADADDSRASLRVSHDTAALEATTTRLVALGGGP